MGLRTGTVLLLGCLLAGAGVSAASEGGSAAADRDAAAAPASPTEAALPMSTWDSEAEAGVVSTTGNSETLSINTRFKIENERERWRHRLNSEYLKVSDKRETTAERTAAAFKTDFKLSERDYLFGSVRYDRDVFTGYLSQFVETAGYGHRFALSRYAQFEAEAGVGGRHTRFTNNTRNREPILRLAAKYAQQIGEGNEFKEEVLMETAGENTRTQSVTSLSTKINGKLSMKLAFTATHNSDVQPGIQKTDTITSVTLVYDLL